MGLTASARFSTSGSRVDLQGWGSEVATTGYGGSHQNPDAPTDPDFWYTGGLAVRRVPHQSWQVRLQTYKALRLTSQGTVTPLQIRTLLVETGSPQLGNTAEHIGPRPELREAIAQLTKIITNTSPTCSAAQANPAALWPPNHQFVPIAVTGGDRSRRQCGDHHCHQRDPG